MRASAPGQSALLMADIAEFLTTQGVRYAVIGAMAAAVHGVVRASLDADAVVALQVREAQTLRQSLVEMGLAEALVSPAVRSRDGESRRRTDGPRGMRSPRR
jgi:hypothetical protein